MHLEIVLPHELIPTTGHCAGDGSAFVIVVDGPREVVECRGLLEDPLPLPALSRRVWILVVIIVGCAGPPTFGVYDAGETEVCGADVVFEVGFGDEVLAAGGLGVEEREVRGAADVKGSADVALAFVCGADVHCEVGFLGEGLGAAEIGAWDVLALRKRGTRMLALDMFLEG